VRAGSPTLRTAPAHGTTSAYTNHGCRCDLCREAWRDYKVPRNRAWSARRRAASGD